MKLKEIDRTANVSWSPLEVCPIYLATGTAAQQLDATFNTTSSLEIYEVNLQEPGLDMLCKGSIATENRCHKLAWGGYGVNISGATSGIIVTGCDGGCIVLYDPIKLIAGDGDAVIFQRDKHSGPVRSLDFNPFQANLLASGASDSEIFIWDLNNPNAPMTPGAKSQPTDDVTCISWNRQVQHILASTFATRCVVWDLRKNEPIIKVSGSTARMRCKVIAWHPEVATQLCLASEDDHTPFIQLWDLRFATSPLKTMENHQRGVLSLAWCPQDPDLLLSCGKDNHIVCWNPNTSDINGEVVCEIPTSNQWSFDVAWCPRNPTLISNCSFDGHVSIYSLLGGVSQYQPSFKIAEAFSGNFVNYNTPDICQKTFDQSFILQKAPKWLKRPVGATFSFGGKLVSFEYLHQTGFGNTQTPQTPTTSVYISQVVTDPLFVNRACELENTIERGQFSAFCDMKISTDNSSKSQQIWKFLQANFETNSKSKLLSLLGYEPSQSTNVNSRHNKEDAVEHTQLSNTNTTSDFSFLSHTSTSNLDPTEPEKVAHDPDEQFVIPADDDVEGSIAHLLLRGDLNNAVELCLQENRLVDAVLLGIVGGDKLLARVQEEYFKRHTDSSLTRLIASVVTKKWNDLFASCNLGSWKEALAGSLVYANEEHVSSLCESLGTRLEKDSTDESHLRAMICYICAGNISKFVSCWSKYNTDCLEPSAIQDLVEQVTVLQHANRLIKNETDCNIPEWTEKLCQYSEFLASQGKLSTALLHLQSLSDEQEIVRSLRERITQALKISTITSSKWPAAEKTGPVANAAPTPISQFSQQQHQNTISDASHQQSVYTPLSTSTVPAMTSTQAASRGHLAQRYPTNFPNYSHHTHSTYAAPHSQPTYSAPQSQSIYSAPQSQPTYSTPQSQPATYSQTILQPNISPNFPPYDFQPAYSPTTFQQQMPGDFQNQVSPYSAIPQYPVEITAGWNDPPSSIKPDKDAKSNYDTPAPITHPLFGTNGMDFNQPRTNDSMYTSIQNEPPLAPNTYQTPQIQTPEGIHSNVTPQEPPKVKGPIPEEHQILHEVFDGLRNKCYFFTNNMQTKRKLDDVAKKLEILYDTLRENKLSPNTLLGLHQIVQLIQQNDFLTALHTHTLIVGKAAFSEISGFMPALKVLLQTASQLAVNFQ